MMSCGGFWSDKPRGFGEIQIERQIARGVQADAARRYVKAMQCGGLTTAEAYAVIRDRDCSHLGYHIELMDYEELPDRWFRNAWKRSQNGGPVGIDLTHARTLQWQYIVTAVGEENERRAKRSRLANAFQMMTGHFGETQPVAVDGSALQTAIHRAKDEEELRRVWPTELNAGHFPRSTRARAHTRHGVLE